MGVLKWLVKNEPVWVASVVMALAGFLLSIGTQRGFPTDIAQGITTLLPLLLAPLTRSQTTSAATVEKVATAAALTGDAAGAVQSKGKL